MRPVRLDVKGFTSFRDAVQIDFADLDVFAIAGPTGSGKSSLLDAMTYALYGRVERVGDRVSQLISQGQPRMAVALEFEVGRERYRVTRSTPVRGGTKILLERRDGGEWKQAGEGADRVREAELMIVRLIGLSYDGFTRSVVLPQGRFAEFLSGDPTKRRAILTELLGLSLFKRMAERAGAIARDAQIRAQATTDLLAREFADATPETLKEGRAAAKAAAKRERLLGRAAERVLDVLERSREARRTADELRACAEEAGDASEQAASAAAALRELGGELEQAAASLEARTAAAVAAREAAGAAEELLRRTEAAWGSATDLAALQGQARSLSDLREATARKEVERAGASEAAQTLTEALARAEAACTERAGAVATWEEAVGVAEAAVEDARHADLVAAVSAGAKAGDPCPVCGVPLQRAPRKATGGLERATKALAAAKKRVETARRAALEAERAAESARREVRANVDEQRRLGAEIDQLSRALDETEAELAAALGNPPPPDPAAEIARRLAELHRLDGSERAASREASDADKAVLRAEADHDRLIAAADLQRHRVTREHRSLFQRASRAAGPGVAPANVPPPPASGDAGSLAAYAGTVADALAGLAERLGRALVERASAEDRLLEEARGIVAGLVEASGSLEELAEAVNAACRNATAEVAGAAQRAEDLAERLERKRQLAGEAAEMEGRALVFKLLAQELRADRLIAYLQAEALQVLAVAGSERLGSLSDGRYRLVCRDEEFLVLDTWNGDEERSVRTLSGGETFLASLALALALADQVRSLSVTDRARLDSLFLDEGFGTLDAETLRVVVDAIEQLGGDGRLVGVITHVRDLADQFSRIEVEKSPRGSRLRLVPA